MAKKNKVILGKTRECLCEAGLECNNYRVCFDSKDRPTENCAVSFCKRYVILEGNAERRNIAEQAHEIISDFKSYNNEDDSSDFHLETLDEVISSMQNFWYNIQDSRSISKEHKRCLEITLRLLELLQ